MGAEFRNITFAGERAAALDTVLRHQTYQVDDRRIRALNTAGERRAAIALCTSYTPGQSDDAFARYDRSLSALIAINQTAFRTAVERGLRSGGLPRSTARGLDLRHAAAGRVEPTQRPSSRAATHQW